MQLPQRDYYAVIFISIKSSNDEGYEELDAATLELAQQQKGYLGHISSFDGKKQIFISYWESEQAIRIWQNNEIHKAAKAKAQVWYDAFISQVCKVDHASFHHAAKLSS
jgi:heme-degrading monooxygenase HmoA